MGALDDVKSWMTYFGWSEGGGPGGVKRDARGMVRAQHGDATWIADIEKAIERAERQKIVTEMERRERLGIPLR